MYVTWLWTRYPGKNPKIDPEMDFGEFSDISCLATIL